MNVSEWRIDTPEQVNLSFDLAGIASRFLAVLLDMLFQSIAFLILFLVLGSALRTQALSSWGIAFLIIAAFVVFYVYFILFEGFTKGKTPGKMICGLCVMRRDGRPLDWSSNLARNLLRLLDFLPLIYGVGFLSMFFSRESQRVGDMVAHTIVVRTRGRSQVSLRQLSSSAGAAPLSGAVSMFPLKQAEFNLINDLLARKQKLNGNTFAALCQRISYPFYEKFSISPQMRYDPEGFLRMLYEEHRKQ